MCVQSEQIFSHDEITNKVNVQMRIEVNYRDSRDVNVTIVIWRCDSPDVCCIRNGGQNDGLRAKSHIRICSSGEAWPPACV